MEMEIDVPVGRSCRFIFSEGGGRIIVAVPSRKRKDSRNCFNACIREPASFFASSVGEKKLMHIHGWSVISPAPSMVRMPGSQVG